MRGARCCALSLHALPRPSRSSMRSNAMRALSSSLGAQHRHVHPGLLLSPRAAPCSRGASPSCCPRCPRAPPGAGGCKLLGRHLLHVWQRLHAVKVQPAHGARMEQWGPAGIFLCCKQHIRLPRPPRAPCGVNSPTPPPPPPPSCTRTRRPHAGTLHAGSVLHSCCQVFLAPSPPPL